MSSRRMSRIAVIVAIALSLLAIAAAIGLHYASKLLKSQIETALGPNSKVEAIELGWSAVTIRQLQLRGPKGWPASHTLRAAAIRIEPDLLGFLSDRSRVNIARITIEDAYLSVLRTRDGKLRLLPSMLENRQRAPKQPQQNVIQIAIGSIALREGKLEFFDASVKQPAHRLRIEQLAANIEDLQLPSLSGRTGIELDGVVRGVQHHGRLSIDGWMELASKNSTITSKLANVDLIVLQPYLIKATETGVKRGTLDMQLHSTVHRNRLKAPGKVTLSDLELGDKGGPFATFMGMPRQAVVTGLKNRNNQIEIEFTLEGNLNDPKFSLNDSFAKTVAVATAGLLGVSIESLVKSLGGAPEGIGSAVKKLFGE